MLKHNIKLIFRNFKKDSSTFLINLIGLSTGLACVLLIFLWVTDELNMDKIHKNDHRLYRVMQNFKFPNKTTTWEITPALLSDAMEAEFSEVEAALTISSAEENPEGVFYKDDKNILANGIFAEEDYFEFFSYPLLKGNPKELLKDKSSIVISDKLALKLFESTENILGKTLDYKNSWTEGTFKITGVFQRPPSNSTAQFDFLMSIDILMADEDASKWTGDYAQNFVLLKEGVEVRKFNRKLSPYIKSKHSTRATATLFLQKYSDRYLYSTFENGEQAGGRIAYVKLFSIIALFILLIACINFMNLSTARASTKMKEIGIKKTIGASRKTLVIQFLSESFFMVILSMILALMIVVLSLPIFNEITGKLISLNIDINFSLKLLGVLFLTGIFAGSYPAFYLSGFKPTMILKSKRITFFGEAWTRKGLVVLQFALSMILIVGVIVVHQQMEFVQNKNLGYNRDNILNFQRVKHDDADVFLTELKKITGVENASNMYGSILEDVSTQGGFSWRGQDADRKYLFKSPIISYDVIETLGMKVLSGKTFSKEITDGRNKIVINESAQKMMNLVDPIGTKIAYGGDQTREIIGVVSDFNYGTIYNKIEPLILRYTSRGNNVLVKMKAGAEKRTIAQIEVLYGKFYPDIPFEFNFIDEKYQALYESESRVAALLKYFSGLAILISCLGLFGLAIFTAERRKKEIGIRKVLGSSIFGIVRMLTSDFTKTVIAAILLAVPLSFLIAKSWLNNFAYSIQLEWWQFIIPAISVLLIAWLTVGIQTFRAARVNPVESLKDE